MPTNVYVVGSPPKARCRLLSPRSRRGEAWPFVETRSGPDQGHFYFLDNARRGGEQSAPRALDLRRTDPGGSGSAARRRACAVGRGAIRDATLEIDDAGDGLGWVAVAGQTKCGLEGFQIATGVAALIPGGTGAFAIERLTESSQRLVVGVEKFGGHRHRVERFVRVVEPVSQRARWRR